jgi:hypothetical protein
MDQNIYIVRQGLFGAIAGFAAAPPTRISLKFVEITCRKALAYAITFCGWIDIATET